MSNEWISVLDSLPDAGEQVNLFSNGLVQEALFYRDTVHSDSWYSHDDRIRHDIFSIQDDDEWLPLPDAPK